MDLHATTVKAGLYYRSVKKSHFAMISSSHVTIYIINSAC